MKSNSIETLEAIYRDSTLLFITMGGVALILLILIILLLVKLSIYGREVRLFRKYIKKEVTNFLNTRV